MTCGIYKLVFQGTDKVYIGQSKNIERRLVEHVNTFTNKTCSKKLLKAISTYGLPTLYILYVAKLAEEDLSSIEHRLIVENNSVINGFNTMYVSSNENLPTIHMHSNSAYSEDQIYEVLELLISDTVLKLEQIERLSNVRISTIEQISAGNTHQWLKHAYPDKYAKLEEMHKNSRTVARSIVTTCPSTTHAYTKEQYKHVLEIAVSNNIKIPAAKYISSITSVGVDVVRDIVSMRRHKWLANECPDNYIKLKQLRRK